MGKNAKAVRLHTISYYLHLHCESIICVLFCMRTSTMSCFRLFLLWCARTVPSRTTWIWGKALGCSCTLVSVKLMSWFVFLFFWACEYYNVIFSWHISYPSNLFLKFDVGALNGIFPLADRMKCHIFHRFLLLGFCNSFSMTTESQQNSVGIWRNGQGGTH